MYRLQEMIVCVWFVDALRICVALAYFLRAALSSMPILFRYASKSIAYLASNGSFASFTPIYGQQVAVPDSFARFRPIGTENGHRLPHRVDQANNALSPLKHPSTMGISCRKPPKSPTNHPLWVVTDTPERLIMEHITLF